MSAEDWIERELHSVAVYFIECLIRVECWKFRQINENISNFFSPNSLFDMIWKKNLFATVFC